MKKRMDYQSWEVLETKGKHQGAIISSMVIVAGLAALVILALGALLGEGLFNRAFWFFLFLIVPAVMMLWGWGISTLLQSRFEDDTRQNLEEA